MKLLATILLLIGISFGQATTEFVKILEVKDRIYYIDRMSIKHNQPLVGYVSRILYGDNIVYNVFVVHCDRREYISSKEYGVVDGVRYVSESLKPKIFPVEKDTPIEVAFNYVCRPIPPRLEAISADD